MESLWVPDSNQRFTRKSLSNHQTKEGDDSGEANGAIRVRGGSCSDLSENEIKYRYNVTGTEPCCASAARMKTIEKSSM